MTNQEEFENTYITSSQLHKELGVTRKTITDMRKRKLLPEPIIVPGISCHIWKRSEVLQNVDAYKINLAAKRRVL